MDNHVSQKLGRLKALRNVVIQGDTPSELSAAKLSVLKKLNAEIENLESLCYEDENILRMPSMAILKVTHVFNEQPKYYFHSDISTQSEVQVEIYSASLDKKTGNPIKENLLHKMSMSEKQFADLLINHNRGSGMPVTLERLSGQALAPFDPNKDFTKSKVQDLREGKGSTSQTDRFERELKEALEQCIAKGRASKTDINEIVKLVNLLQGNFKGNIGYHVERLSSETNKRIVEAGVNMHYSVNQFAAITGHKLTIENKDTKQEQDDD